MELIKVTCSESTPRLLCTRLGALSSLLLTFTLSFVSCSRAPHHDGLSAIFGRVFTSESIYVFPGEGWKLQPDGTMEILGRSAAIFCYIPEDFNKSVTFILFLNPPISRLGSRFLLSGMVRASFRVRFS